jgi:hypothetical protein
MSLNAGEDTFHLVRGSSCDVCGPLDSKGWPVMLKDASGKPDRRYAHQHPVTSTNTDKVEK